MAQGFYSLEEAAQRLGISPAKLSQMAQRKEQGLRPFADRGTWRFRAQDIEELVRQRGGSSDPELQLGDSGKKQGGPRSPAPSAPPAAPEVFPFELDAGEEEDFGTEMFEFDQPEAAPGVSDRRSKVQPPQSGPGSSKSKLRTESDSDVRLVPQDIPMFVPASGVGSGEPPPGLIPGSDSDVRLVDDDEPLLDLDLDVSGGSQVPLSSATAAASPESDVRLVGSESTKSPTPKRPSSKKLPPLATGSDSDVRLVAPEPKKPSSKKIQAKGAAAPGTPSSSKKGLAPLAPGSDSDVRLVAPAPVKPSTPVAKKPSSLLSQTDSDVRLIGPEPTGPVTQKPPSSAKKPPSSARARQSRIKDSKVQVNLDRRSAGAAGDSSARLKDDDAITARPLPGEQPYTESGVNLGNAPFFAGAQARPDSSLTDEEINLDEELSQADQSPPAELEGSDPQAAMFELTEMNLELASATNLPPPPTAGTPPASDEMPPLQLAEDEIELGPLRGDSDLTKSSRTSGINLSAPIDSGISLEQRGRKDDIEVSFLPDPVSHGGNTPRPMQSPTGGVESSDEFELSLDDDPSIVSEPFELSDEELELSNPPPKSSVSNSGKGAPPQHKTKLGKAPAEDSSDFELSLEDSSENDVAPFELSDPIPPASGSSAPPSSGRLKKPATEEGDDSSDFELTLDDSILSDPTDQSLRSGGLFETDLQIPSISDEGESGSEVVTVDEDTDLESSSEFDLAIDDEEELTDEETGSEVIVIDEDAGEADETRVRTPPGELEDEGSLENLFSETGESGETDYEEVAEGDEDLTALSEDETAEEEEELRRLALAGVTAQAPAEWGFIPSLLLLPTTLVMILVGFLLFEMLQSVWSYDKPMFDSGPLADFFAKYLK
jgi:hypothetical protein